MSSEKYKMVGKLWIFAVEALDGQYAIAGTPVSTPPVCQLPRRPSPVINIQIQEAVSVSLFHAAVLDLWWWLKSKIHIVKTVD